MDTVPSLLMITTHSLDCWTSFIVESMQIEKHCLGMIKSTLFVVESMQIEKHCLGMIKSTSHHLGHHGYCAIPTYDHNTFFGLLDLVHSGVNANRKTLSRDDQINLVR